MVLPNVSLVTVSDRVERVAPRPRQTRTRTAEPVTGDRVSAAALATALRIAGGDRSRLRFLPDGSVLVHNHRR